MPDEFNVLIGAGVREADKESFFGPLRPEDEFHTFAPEIRYPELLQRLGIFVSRSDARRNGWDRDIPEGWSDFQIGKLRRRICILKITRPEEEPEARDEAVYPI
jgi:hypothetical protein